MTPLFILSFSSYVLIMNKSIDERISELRTSLRAIDNANDHFERTGDEAYLYDIAGRVRALVCTGGRTMSPLLIQLSKELGIELEICSLPPRKVSNEEINASEVIGKTWSTRPKRNFRKYSLEEWFDTPIYFLRKTQVFLTRNYVIREIAEKEGGAHFDKKLTPLILQLKGVCYEIGSSKKINGTQMILLDVAPAVFFLGQSLLLLNELKRTVDNIVFSEQGRRRRVIVLKREMRRLSNIFENLRPFGMYSFELEIPKS